MSDVVITGIGAVTGLGHSAEQNWEALLEGRSAVSSRHRALHIGRTGGGLREGLVEVLRLLASGLSNSKIGAELFISETTAKFHVGNILRKLGVSRRAEAVYVASKAGLL